MPYARTLMAVTAVSVFESGIRSLTVTVLYDCEPHASVYRLAQSSKAASAPLRSRFCTTVNRGRRHHRRGFLSKNEPGPEAHESRSNFDYVPDVEATTRR
jgi:hypothetical protein